MLIAAIAAVSLARTRVPEVAAQRQPAVAGLRTAAGSPAGPPAIAYFHMWSPSAGVAVDTKGRSWRTADGGHRWHACAPLSATLTTVQSAAAFRQPGTAWIAGTRAGGAPVLLITRDRCASWQRIDCRPR